MSTSPDATIFVSSDGVVRFIFKHAVEAFVLTEGR
jgi:sRNA-binding regulator protein Hfq